MKFKSFAARLSTYTAIITTIVMTVVMFVFYISSRKQIVNTAIKNSHSLLKSMAGRIESNLDNVEISLLNCQWMVEENLNNPDSLFKIIGSLVKTSDLIIGSCIAFEPNFYPQKGKYYMLYALEDKNDKSKISYKELKDSIKYNYFDMDWYSKVKEYKTNIWSEPYFDKGASNMSMCTFSHPLYDSAGRLYAIFTADITLKDFSELTEQLQTYRKSYSFILSKQGNLITPPNKEYNITPYLFKSSSTAKYPKLNELGKNMIEGKSGTTEFKRNDKKYFAFYTHIENTQWSLCSICPSSVILTNLNTTSRNIIVIFLFGIVILFISTSKAISKLSSPLAKFSKSAKEISMGNFNTSLPKIKSEDEMLTLYNSFANMQHELEKYIIELKESTAAKERIDSELKIAQKIQMAMVPTKFPAFGNTNNIDLMATMIPAKEVGGDLYNYFIKENKLYFIIGDVSGKGIPASLLMAIASKLFITIAGKYDNPKDIVESLNMAMCKDNDLNMFITLCSGILDLTSGLLLLCNAGHNPPIIKKADENSKFLHLNTNLPVGIINDFKYKEDSQVVPTNTKLFLYTDGVTEAENKEKELYTQDRLLEVFERISSNKCSTIIKYISNDIDAHTKGYEQSDDISALIINYMPNNKLS